MTSGACVNTAPRAQPRSPSRRLAVEQLAGLVTLDKITASTKELKTLMLDHGCTLMDLTGVCPVVAARILADGGDVARFADRSRFSPWTGTAPLDASSGGCSIPDDASRGSLLSCHRPREIA